MRLLRDPHSERTARLGVLCLALLALGGAVAPWFHLGHDAGEDCVLCVLAGGAAVAVTVGLILVLDPGPAGLAFPGRGAPSPGTAHPLARRGRAPPVLL